MAQKRIEPGLQSRPEAALDSQLHYFARQGWFGEGELSKWTPPVRKFVSDFRVGGPPGFNDVKELATRVQRFEVVPMPYEVIVESYARLSASEIIERREVFVPQADAKGFELPGFPQVNGCQDRSLVLATCLRFLKVPAVFTRKGTHSSVRFMLGKDTYDVGHEPNPEFFSETVQLSREDLAKSQILSTKGFYREGLDPADVGMKSILDFYICSPNGQKYLRPFMERYRGALVHAGLA
ncbi:MAG: hypothetical protein NTU61_05370 [Candidatus Altiarchaeota archaeon]|nr:hypothetical protein [Candidatus Altiarchaeota archaeon]